MYGAAILDACQQLAARLAPYRAKLGPEATFLQVPNCDNFALRVDCTEGT